MQWCRRGSNVIVIHPGSRSLRIGKASDVNPVSVPNVIARKHKETVPEPIFSEGIYRPRNKKPKPQSPAPVENGDEYAVTADSDDPVCPLNSIKARIHSIFLFTTCSSMRK
jgi:actin-related protein 8